MKRLAFLFVFALVLVYSAAAQGLFESEFVFDPEMAVEPHGHVHASCIVECPNGDLRAVWYENGHKLPPPYSSEHQDKSADVRIGGSRKQANASEWEASFVMSDTFGLPDNNPCMVIDKQGRLWLLHVTLLGVPESTWGSCLIRYMVSSRYDHPGRPTWDKVNLLVPQVTGLDEVVKTTLEARKAEGWPDNKVEDARKYIDAVKAEPLSARLGWMPRAHPLVRNDGAILVPLANENNTAACMAITEDNGNTWLFSSLVPDLGLEQPSVVQYPDGAMTAFFRNDGNRIKRSDSADGGMTWGPVTRTDRPHPGAGIEAILLSSGKLLLIYNDDEKERDTLAVSLSEDRGKTWQWTRHLERTKGERFDYPSVVQAKDGSIHASYSYNLKTIKHARFDEAWIMAGDP